MGFDQYHEPADELPAETLGIGRPRSLDEAARRVATPEAAVALTP